MRYQSRGKCATMAFALILLITGLSHTLMKQPLEGKKGSNRCEVKRNIVLSFLHNSTEQHLRKTIDIFLFVFHIFAPGVVF